MRACEQQLLVGPGQAERVRVSASRLHPCLREEWLFGTASCLSCASLCLTASRLTTTSIETNVLRREGGIFPLKMSFSERYPEKPPRVRFTCELFHPNVYADGNICMVRVPVAEAGGCVKEVATYEVCLLARIGFHARVLLLTTTTNHHQ